MPTLRRIPKYTPVVVMALLVVAWSATSLAMYAVSFGLPLSKRQYAIIGNRGSLAVNFQYGGRKLRLWWYARDRPLTFRHMAGEFHSDGFLDDGAKAYWQIELPFIFFVTAALPLAIGPFRSFRFRLWHYLAYTALVAVEFAYYLRWQE